MRKPTTKKSAEIHCEICLYGTRKTGAGWLALFAGRMAGNGDPVATRSFTEAIWMAAEALRALGAAGNVAIHAPGGERMAVCPIGNVPTFGDLPWQPAPQHVISAEAIVTAVEKQ